METLLAIYVDTLPGVCIIAVVALVTCVLVGFGFRTWPR